MKEKKKKEIEDYDAEDPEEEQQEEEQEEQEQEEPEKTRFPVKKPVKYLPKKEDSIKQLKKEVEKEEEEEQERYIVANVPTNKEPMIVDMNTKTPLSTLEVMTRILNWLEAHE
jgi:hypothetical protein